MADENEKWEMPKPVFRSSTGSLPKTLQRTISGYNMPRVNMNAPEEDDDILSVLEPPKNVQPEPPESSEVKPVATTESQPVETAAPAPAAVTAPADEPTIPNPVKVKAAEVTPKRSGFSSFLVIFLLIAILAAAVVVGVIYFLPRYLQTGNGTF